MNINANLDGNVCTLAVDGRIDALTAPQFEQTFNEYSEKCDKMIFDFAQTEYISSAGLRVIIIAHRTMESKGGLVLKNLNKNVETIINVTGFGKKLNIEY